MLTFGPWDMILMFLRPTFPRRPPRTPYTSNSKGLSPQQAKIPNLEVQNLMRTFLGNLQLVLSFLNFGFSASNKPSIVWEVGNVWTSLRERSKVEYNELVWIRFQRLNTFHK